MPSTPTRRIEILLYPDVLILDATGVAQVFATANDLAPAGAPRPYAIAVVAAGPEIVSSSGLTLAAGPLTAPDRPLDTLLIPGGPGVQAVCRQNAVVDWVARRAGTARRAASVCTGAFLLAQTGLLDGRRAVTHWQRCAEFAARFPAVRLDPEPIFLRDGKFWTSAGITAGIDLALAMVEEDLGHEAALAVARHLVVFLKRPGGQAQFSTALALQQGGAQFEALNAWIVANLGRDLSLATLADRAGMSQRSLSRRYRAATGQTPARAVETLRIETARRLLEQGASVKQVYRRCGFGSDETFRRAFAKQVGVTPQAYRQRFAR